MTPKCLALLFAGTALAVAQTITIQNPSFENANLTITGPYGTISNILSGSTLYPLSGSLSNWTAVSTTKSAGAGAATGPLGVNTFTSPFGTGSNWGYAQVAAAGSAALMQLLPDTLKANTTYTLTVKVGHPGAQSVNGVAVRFAYDIELWAGTTEVGTASNLNLPPNSSGTDTITYSSGNSALVGQPLRIVLTTTGDDGAITEAFFDDVALTASTATIVNAVIGASGFGAFPTAAPGSWVEIYGANLSGNSRSWALTDFNGNNAPTSLDGTTVTIAGKSAFIDYISPNQINALLPSDTPTGAQQLLIAGTGGTVPYSLTVNPVQPGFLAPLNFKIGAVQYAVAVFPDGAFALPIGAIPGVNSRPAKPGDIITLYGIGFGPVTPSIPAGQLAQQLNMLAMPLLVNLGGIPATLSYDGLAPGYTGLYQINLIVPSIPAGNAALAFTLGGTAGTQTLYLPIGN